MIWSAWCGKVKCLTMLMDGNSESRSQSISLTVLFHVFFNLLRQAGKYWKAEEAQERKQPAAYAITSSCVCCFYVGWYAYKQWCGAWCACVFLGVTPDLELCCKSWIFCLNSLHLPLPSMLSLVSKVQNSVFNWGKLWAKSAYNFSGMSTLACYNKISYNH